MQNAETNCPIYSNTKLSYDQDVIYRQENIPRDRTYRIFPPASERYSEPQSHKFNIASIKNKDDLLVSNLPLIERARLQKYDIKCTPKHYNLMIEATKYIFDAFSFEFESNDREFFKTHYFSIAPNLNINPNVTSLPTIYRTSVCVEKDKPKHFSFSTYAIVGGYSDGFYFMNRLDNNYNEFAHVCKGSRHGAPKKSQIVQFPHMHQPSFKYKEQGLHEFNTPYYLPNLRDKDMHNCLNFYLKHNSISHDMLLVRDNMTIDDVTQYAKIFHLTHSLEDTQLGQLGKIAVTNVGHYAVSTETNDYHAKLPDQECGAPYLRP